MIATRNLCRHIASRAVLPVVVRVVVSVVMNAPSRIG
jgi:hypothetical protein